MPERLTKRAQIIENEYFRKIGEQQVARMKELLSRENQVSTAPQCPKCDGRLREIEFEEIRIDVCDKCNGVWLDAGELALVTYRDERGWLTRLLS
jgi:ribosomal protein L37AE/L43A